MRELAFAGVVRACHGWHRSREGEDKDRPWESPGSSSGVIVPLHEDIGSVDVCEQ